MHVTASRPGTIWCRQPGLRSVTQWKTCIMRRSTVNRDIRFGTVTLKIRLFCVKCLARQHKRCEAFWLCLLSVFMCFHNNFCTQLNRLNCRGEAHISPCNRPRRSRELYSFFILGARWGGGWSRSRPAAVSPGMTWFPSYRRLGGPQGRSGHGSFIYHHHHHQVPEGLGVFPVPWSSRWIWSLHLFLDRPMFLRLFGSYCSACFGSLSVSILCTCCSHFFWYCFVSFTMFCAPVFFA